MCSAKTECQANDVIKSSNKNSRETAQAFPPNDIYDATIIGMALYIALERKFKGGTALLLYLAV